MRTIAELIREWMSGDPKRRTAASLSRATGVPKNTLSTILSGNREPGIETAARLARVLPRDEVAMIVLAGQPDIRILFGCYSRCESPSVMQLGSSEH